jgi:hypothetical protein
MTPVEPRNCPICGAPATVEMTANGVDVRHLTIDPQVLLRAAGACHVVALALAGGTSTTTRVAQLQADEYELRAAAGRIGGKP